MRSPALCALMMTLKDGALLIFHCCTFLVFVVASTVLLFGSLFLITMMPYLLSLVAGLMLACSFLPKLRARKTLSMSLRSGGVAIFLGHLVGRYGDYATTSTEKFYASLLPYYHHFTSILGLDLPARSLMEFHTFPLVVAVAVVALFPMIRVQSVYQENKERCQEKLSLKTAP